MTFSLLWKDGGCHGHSEFCNSKKSLIPSVGVPGTHWGPLLLGGNGSSSTTSPVIKGEVTSVFEREGNLRGEKDKRIVVLKLALILGVIFQSCSSELMREIWDNFEFFYLLDLSNWCAPFTSLRDELTQFYSEQLQLTHPYVNNYWSATHKN